MCQNSLCFTNELNHTSIKGLYVYMMASKKRAPPANSEIIREQIQLLAAEKELMATLDNIKDQINKLLVS